MYIFTLMTTSLTLCVWLQYHVSVQQDCMLLWFTCRCPNCSLILPIFTVSHLNPRFYPPLWR